MSIHFDYTAIFEDTVEDRCGLKNGDLADAVVKFYAINADVKSRYDAGELPFWDLPFETQVMDEVETFAATARKRFRNFVLLGIGGSALGPIALHQCLNHLQYNLLPDDQRPGCRFFCPDNVDPDLVSAALDVAPPEETLFNVVSKSGGTAETAAQFLVVLDILKRKLGDHWREHLVVTTDPEKGSLRKFADDNDVKAFSIPPLVGGRFTVLTPVGLLPAAMVGLDIRGLCRGAGALKEACFQPELEQNPAGMLAALLYLLQMRRGLPIHVVFAYSNRLYGVADWFRQLWAESLGKRHGVTGSDLFTGPTPVKAVGATDQHSQVQLYVEGPYDKAFLFLGARRFHTDIVIPDAGAESGDTDYLRGAKLSHLLNAERRATAYALTRAGRPNMTLELDAIDPAHVGALLYLLEAATLFAGGFYGVNPLDQPGVEAGKKATYALMGRVGYAAQRNEMEAFDKRKKRGMELRI